MAVEEAIAEERNSSESNNSAGRTVERKFEKRSEGNGK